MATDPITSISPDPSPYIRTYAKDVAALTGQNIASGKAQSPKDFEPTSAKKNEPLMVSAGKSAAPADLAQLQQDVGSGNADKESEQAAEERIQDIGGAPSSGILQSISLPNIEPGDIVQPMQSAQSAVPNDSRREDILARLRAKAAAARPPSTPLMPSTFEAPPLVEAAPQQVPEPAHAEPTASPFHSFSSDFADRIDEQHASKFSVLAAEKDTGQKRERPKRNLHLLPIFAGIVLVLGGGAGVYATYHYMTTEAPVPTAPSVSSLIIPDEKIALTGSGATLLQALANQANQPIPANTVLLTYTTTSSTTPQGPVEAPATGGAFLAALNLPAPDIFLRNIDPSSMVGVVNDGEQTRPFFIFRVDSYESTFAGMLDWEPTIGNDLALLYPAYPALVPAAPVIATSTATTTSTTKTKSSTKTASTTPVSTPVPQTLPVIPPQFIDEVVDNHDTRALKDFEGRTVLMYGYADKQTLILARDEAAFTLLLNRLQTNQQ